MRVAVTLNVVVGVLLSLLYIVVTGYIWRYRNRFWVLLALLNASVYIYQTAAYLQRAIAGDIEIRPISWGVLIVVLPALQIMVFIGWLARDAARGQSIASQAQLYTEEANQRAYQRTVEEEEFNRGNRVELAKKLREEKATLDRKLREEQATLDRKLREEQATLTRQIREEQALKDRQELAIERSAAAQERGEATNTRTADATERIADAAEVENPRPGP